MYLFKVKDLHCYCRKSKIIATCKFQVFHEMKQNFWLSKAYMISDEICIILFVTATTSYLKQKYLNNPTNSIAYVFITGLCKLMLPRTSDITCPSLLRAIVDTSSRWPVVRRTKRRELIFKIHSNFSLSTVVFLLSMIMVVLNSRDCYENLWLSKFLHMSPTLQHTWPKNRLNCICTTVIMLYICEWRIKYFNL